MGGWVVSGFLSKIRYSNSRWYLAVLYYLNGNWEDFLVSWFCRNHDRQHNHKKSHEHHHNHDKNHHHHPHNRKSAQNRGRTNISAVCAFGDSSTDAGKNINANLKTPYGTNRAPYGCDFPYHAPTGRSSNGKLIVDLIVFSLGPKDTLMPYSEPSRTDEDLRTGVSFDISGTGLDKNTAVMDGVGCVNQQLGTPCTLSASGPTTWSITTATLTRR